MKLVFLDAKTIGDDIDLSAFDQLGEVVKYSFSQPEEVPERVTDADVLIVNKIRIDEAAVKNARNLKLVCVTATGTNNLDKAYLESRGIAWRNVADYSTESVAQHTFAMLFFLLEKLRYYDEYVKEGRYINDTIFTHFAEHFYEIKGKTWGIIGLGNIGSRVARVGEAFSMEVSYFSTSGTSHSREYPSISLDELMSTSDIVSIHAPYNERTAGLVGEAELGKMKPSAYIINMGRGGIIDESALAKAIDEGRIAGAGVDVFTSEPLPADNPLMKVRNRDRLVLTPHIGWASIEARERLVSMIADNISTACSASIG